MNEPHITLTGNVAAKPELRMVNDGIPVTSFRVAATPRRRDKASGEWSDGETLWFNVTVWRALAEHCVTSLSKGDKVVVTGRLASNSWVGKDGVVRAGLQVDASAVGLELSRSSALSSKRSAPSQRNGEEPEDGAQVDPWASSGQADQETGEVYPAGPLVPLHGDADVDGDEDIDREESSEFEGTALPV